MIADELREDIQSGALAGGERLMQGEIAQRFEVSITPVREAFTKLEGEGLVVIDQHRGAVVFRPTFADFKECFEIRELLEARAVAKAVPKLTPAILDELQSLIEEMRQTPDRAQWVELNDRFHLQMYEPGGEPRLLKLIAGLRDESVAYLNIFASARVRELDRVEREHQQILDACRAGDIEAAVSAVQAHLRRPVENASDPSDELTTHLVPTPGSDEPAPHAEVGKTEPQDGAPS